MDLGEFLKNPGKEKHSIDIGLAIIRILQLTNNNTGYLKKILKNQIELKELLKGNSESEIDDIVMEKFQVIEDEIIKISNEDYLKILQGILNKDK